MKLMALLRRICRSEGTEIIEFAVSVPILVVLVVGIYDFGSAFTLKHRLNAAVREGARMASSELYPPDPGAVGSCGVPSSICVVRDVVASDLQETIGNDCGLGTAAGVYGGAGTYTWTFTGSCPGFSLEIKRGILNPNTASLSPPFDPTAYNVENTKVTMVYPYQWQFNSTFKLLDSNANYLTSSITVTSTMQNLD
jgi:hypothetical protein